MFNKNSKYKMRQLDKMNKTITHKWKRQRLFRQSESQIKCIVISIRSKETHKRTVRRKVGKWEFQTFRNMKPIGNSPHINLKYKIR